MVVCGRQSTDRFAGRVGCLALLLKGDDLMTALEVIVGVLSAAALVQGLINTSKLKDLEMKMRGVKFKKATRR